MWSARRSVWRCRRKVGVMSTLFLISLSDASLQSTLHSLPACLDDFHWMSVCVLIKWEFFPIHTFFPRWAGSLMLTHRAHRALTAAEQVQALKFTAQTHVQTHTHTRFPSARWWVKGINCTRWASNGPSPNQRARHSWCHLHGRRKFANAITRSLVRAR